MIVNQTSYTVIVSKVSYVQNIGYTPLNACECSCSSNNEKLSQPVCYNKSPNLARQGYISSLLSGIVTSLYASAIFTTIFLDLLSFCVSIFEPIEWNLVKFCMFRLHFQTYFRAYWVELGLLNVPAIFSPIFSILFSEIEVNWILTCGVSCLWALYSALQLYFLNILWCLWAVYNIIYIHPVWERFNTIVKNESFVVICVYSIFFLLSRCKFYDYKSEYFSY